MTAKKPGDKEDQSSKPDEHQWVPQALYRGQHGLGALRGHRSIAWRTVETVLESGLFDPPSSSNWLVDPEFLFHRRRWTHTSHGFFRDMLGSPESVTQAPMWELFWALTEASHRFATRYIRFWSHEERLTGHLISEVARAAEGGTELFDASALRGRVRFYYADTAARSMEAKTGADFALIVQVSIPDGGEVFKVARFQAKKVGPNGKARIELDQLTVLRGNEALGYYVFYYAPDNRGRLLAPTTTPASEIQPTDDGKAKRMSFDARSSMCDFATFVVFALADPGSDHGMSAGSAEEAARIALHGRKHLERPSRAVILSIGRSRSEPDWRALLGGDEMFRPGDEAE